MKIRLAISEEKTQEVKDYLTARGIETDEDAPFLLTEVSRFVSNLPVKSMDRTERCYIPVSRIVYLESYGHDVYVHAEDKDYLTNDPLRQLEYLLDPLRFMRVSSSVIVSRLHIREIRPALSRKFVLVMSDGTLVDVTRSYYSSFRDQMGL